MMRVMAQPISEPTYYLLAALLDGPLHGYAIAKAAADLSQGEVRLPAGTLYGALDRLVDRGLLRETGEEIIDGRRRRAYALTNAGRATLIVEAQRMRRAAAVVERRRSPIPVKAVRT
jgi:DNA-binding PadR family transcriptional regulator